MAIDFTETSAQYISYAIPAVAADLTVFSVFILFNQDTKALNVVPFRTHASGTTRKAIQFNLTNPGWLRLQVAFSGGLALWNTSTDVLPADGNNHSLSVTYDGSSASNDPIFYVDGVVKAIGGDLNSTGTISTGETGIEIGGHSAFDTSMDGSLLSVLYFNRIITPAEVAEFHSKKLAIPTWRGLVFAPQLWQRGEVGEGGTLTASHTIACAISGALGTPAGSPLHRQDAYLTY